jgi:hypothetical protein
MVKALVTFAVVGLMAGTLFIGCTDSSGKKVEAAKENVDNATQDLKVAQAKYSDEWQTFKSESERKISDNESSINTFKEKMEKSGSKLKARYGKTVRELEQKNRDLKGKMDDYKDEGKDKWEEFKSGFNRDMDKVEVALKNLTKDND